MLVLIAASTVATKQVPSIMLKSNHLQHRLHKYSDNAGYLQMHKVNLIGPDMDLLHNILAEEPSGLLTKEDSTTLVINCRANSTTTFNDTNFKPGMLKLFEHSERSPIQGIMGSLPICGQGIISLQVISNSGEIVNIKTSAYYILELKTKLFSPQAYFHECNDDSELIIKWSCALMQLASSKEGEEFSEITFNYNKQMSLPTMRAYHNALTTARALALNACLTDEKNQNLTAAQKLLLCWHFKIGHDGFALIKWLSTKGYFGMKGSHMAHTNCNPINVEHTTWESNNKWSIFRNMLRTRIWVS